MGVIPLAAGAFKAGEKLFEGPPPAPDYMALTREQARLQNEMLERQTELNRPNQQTPWATSTWTTGPDGKPMQRLALSGGLGEAADALQGQLAQNMKAPLDFSTLPGLESGEEASMRASEAAYKQMASRLDPQWAEQEERNRTRLLNQGLAEGSEAYNRAMDRLSNQRTDAYNQANLSAIREGASAGNMRFQQGMASRQQMLQEMLRQRQQPLSELQALQGFTAMPGFNQAGQGRAPELLQAGNMQHNAALQQWQAQQQMLMDLIGAGTQLAGTVGMVASDERVKVDVTRLPVDAAPGVPAATFRYRREMRMPGLYQGVIAQDLQKERPDAVVAGEDGILYVGPEFAPVKIGD